MLSDSLCVRVKILRTGEVAFIIRTMALSQVFGNSSNQKIAEKHFCCYK